MSNDNVPNGATVTELVTPFEQSTNRGKHVKHNLLSALTGEAGTVSDALEDYLHAFSSYVSGDLDPVAKAAISVCAVSRSKSHQYKINQLIESVASFATPDEVLQKINKMQLTADSHSDDVVLLLQHECSETAADLRPSHYVNKFSQYNADGTSNPYCSQWWAALEAANKAWFERVAYSPWVFDLVVLRGIPCFMEEDQQDGEAIGEELQYILSLKYWNDWETILDTENAEVLSGHRGWKRLWLQNKTMTKHMTDGDEEESAVVLVYAADDEDLSNDDDSAGLKDVGGGELVVVTEQAPMSPNSRSNHSVNPFNEPIIIAHKQGEDTSLSPPGVSESAHSIVHSAEEQLWTEQMGQSPDVEQM